MTLRNPEPSEGAERDARGGGAPASVQERRLFNMTRALSLSCIALLAATALAPLHPQARVANQSGSPGVSYVVTFPEPEHHWLQVEMTVTGLGSAPLQARMSRS